MDELCRKEADRILWEEKMEKEKKEACASPDIPMVQENEGVKRAYESPPSAATSTSSSSSSGEGAAIQ